jgi:hypothetical protein
MRYLVLAVLVGCGATSGLDGGSGADGSGAALVGDACEELCVVFGETRCISETSVKTCTAGGVEACWGRNYGRFVGSECEAGRTCRGTACLMPDGGR